jgi:hypothetical protein
MPGRARVVAGFTGASQMLRISSLRLFTVRKGHPTAFRASATRQVRSQPFPQPNPSHLSNPGTPGSLPVSKSRPKFSFDIGNSAPSSGDSGQMHFTVTEVCGRRRRPCPSNGVNRKSLFYWLRAYPNWSTRPSMEPNYPRDHYSWQMGAAVHHWSLPRKFMGGGAPFSRRTP